MIFLFISVSLAALLCLSLASWWSKDFTWKRLGLDVLRELGMALLIALLVGLFFEIQEQTHRSRLTIAGVLDASMGEYAPVRSGRM